MKTLYKTVLAISLVLLVGLLWAKGSAAVPSATSAARLIPSFDSPVVLYCRSGRRSSIAVTTLVKLGYTAVRDLGAITAWKY